MKELEVKKSVWKVINFWSILACILIIPIFILVIRILIIKKEKITFYNDRIVVEEGFFTKKVNEFSFAGVFSVSTRQSLWGRMFKYGDVIIDFVGKNDINTRYVKNPEQLVSYLKSRIVQRGQTSIHMF